MDVHTDILIYSALSDRQVAYVTAYLSVANPDLFREAVAYCMSAEAELARQQAAHEARVRAERECTHETTTVIEPEDDAAEYAWPALYCDECGDVLCDCHDVDVRKEWDHDYGMGEVLRYVCEHCDRTVPNANRGRY